MITIKSPREIKLMKKSGNLLANVHKELRSFIKEGVTTWDIEVFVRDYIPWWNSCSNWF
jgi:methionyl aminopeptidase